MNQKIVAPCGTPCFICEAYEDNVTPEFQMRISELTKVPMEKVSCKGCTKDNTCLFIEMRGGQCSQRQCVDDKGVEFCHECHEFPCDYLMPIADGAAKYPHNIKLFNLCRMKSVGLEQWMEEAAGIKQTYFEQSFRIGEGGSKQ